MPSALIVYGGWQGHDPEGVSAFLESLLRDHGFETDRTDEISALADPDRLSGKDLVVPVVTMADPPEQGFAALLNAAQNGAGLAGCHGGMCDSFRTNTDWQFLTGGQFVAHPGDTLSYTIQIKDREHPITRGVDDFRVETEQYYMHVDPANHVLATTRAPIAAGPYSSNEAVDMPVAWTRQWGRGRVFYFEIGHALTDLESPSARRLMLQGMLWAAGH
jgi:type 1 glutamine amidotransferase